MIETISITEDNGNIKQVGEIYNRCFYRRVKEDKHLFRTLNAWGIDAEVFNTVLLTECERIKFYDTQKHLVYEVPVIRFKEFGSYQHHKPHRPQIFLPLIFWSVRKK
jgi:hypothetical protein